LQIDGRLAECWLVRDERMTLVWCGMVWCDEHQHIYHLRGGECRSVGTMHPLRIMPQWTARHRLSGVLSLQKSSTRAISRKKHVLHACMQAGTHTNTHSGRPRHQVKTGQQTEEGNTPWPGSMQASHPASEVYIYTYIMHQCDVHIICMYGVLYVYARRGRESN